MKKSKCLGFLAFVLLAACGAGAKPGNPLSFVLASGVTMEFVRIPAGDFLMGSVAGDTDAYDNEKPQHKVTLDEYLIGKYDVTNAQYAAFAKATNRAWTMPSGKENHPVVKVTWNDAVAFCVWASQVTGRKVKLPSEAQWEKAARGAEGKLYPWGDSVPDPGKLNYMTSKLLDTTAVGKYSPAGDSPYGVADMAGNVWQWTSSAYKPYPYNPNDGRENEAADRFTERVMRGGDFNGSNTSVRSATRSKLYPELTTDGYGFRAAILP